MITFIFLFAYEFYTKRIKRYPRTQKPTNFKQIDHYSPTALLGHE